MNRTIYVNGRFLTQEMTGVQRVATQVGILLQQHYKEKIIFLYPNSKLLNPNANELNIVQIGKLDGYVWEQFELPKYLYEKKANILLNFCNTAPILFKRNIIVIHDMAIKHNHTWFNWKFIKVYNFLYYFNIRRAKKIITVSNFSKDEILKYYPQISESKICVIYLASFLDLKNNTKSKTENYFIAVNSLSTRKNVETIITAFKLLNPAKYKLKIVGGVNKKVFGNNVSENESNIEFLGNVSDEQLYSLLFNAKGFINASWYEGFGLPPLEAMSVKTPCILSDIPVYRELYNTNALFFNPASPEDLSNRIKELDDVKNFEIYKHKAYKASQRFSWNCTKENYIKILTKEMKI